MRNYIQEIPEFVSYCESFYSNQDPEAPHPIASPDQIRNAVNLYLDSKPLNAIEFDSFDREKVREILQPGYSIF